MTILLMCGMFGLPTTKLASILAVDWLLDRLDGLCKVSVMVIIMMTTTSTRMMMMVLPQPSWASVFCHVFNHDDADEEEEEENIS